ncbi:flagellar hook-basal body complex protein FliE [Cellulomonas marina]|uniref:Flagellar hook-basal body complex protein FliE n=1 Tax=Cellulomonas marina TaxID=988821 RepID=A0A1I0WJS6_9CELL|nr:flagellar hook-basal body complex protein FliE [Cellulomonas marina]GIG27664.1 flagellar hook-basal body complex protein FliE [Cellulomonas marina]SFA88233.1 flagellar hook-basal body complex protein FliE [Cellulomonas marina]
MSTPLSAIGAIGAVAPVAPTGYLDGPDVTGAAGAAGVPSTSGAGFASVLGSVESLQGLQATSNDLAVKAVTGDLSDVHDYTIASARAATALELTAAVRNKAVEAFTEILRMQA